MVDWLRVAIAKGGSGYSHTAKGFLRARTIQAGIKSRDESSYFSRSEEPHAPTVYLWVFIYLRMDLKREFGEPPTGRLKQQTRI